MDKIRLLYALLCLSLLSGSVCTYPATLRTVQIDTVWHKIPGNYYNYAPVIPAGVDPYAWLGNLEWDKDYKMNEWDCSNMALYMEWMLENAGVTARIQTGYQHAWLMIWRTDKEAWWAYECVGLRWIHPWVGGNYYHPENTYSDIYMLREQYAGHILHFMREWCWWRDISHLQLSY